MAKQELENLALSLGDAIILEGETAGLTSSNLKTSLPTGEGSRASSGQILTDVSQEIEELFIRAESRHGILTSQIELKRIAQQVLQGQNLTLLKTAMLTSYHLIYDVLAIAGKKICILFLNQAVSVPMLYVLPKQNIRPVTLETLATLEEDELLFVENADLFDELPASDKDKVKKILLKHKLPKVLITGFISYSLFTRIKDEIGQELLFANLDGRRIEHIHISASKDENKVLGLKSVLRASIGVLERDDKILILVQTQEEATELKKSLELDQSAAMMLSNVCFGPLSKLVLSMPYALVIYFCLPRKVEQILSHISLVYSNYFFRNYAKMKQSHKIYFHFITSAKDFQDSRFALFQNKPTKLQITRFFKSIEASLEKEPPIGTIKIRLPMKKLAQAHDLSIVAVSKLLSKCSSRGIFSQCIKELLSITFKVNRESKNIQSLVKDLKRVNNCYNLDLQSTASSLQLSEQELMAQIRTHQIDTDITITDQDFALNIQLPGKIGDRLNELVDAIDAEMKREFQIESEMMKLIFIMFRQGATSPASIFSSKPGQPMNLIQKNLKALTIYSIEKLEELFQPNVVDSILGPLRGGKKECDEAFDALTSLLRSDKSGFLRKELDLCLGGQQSAREYVTTWLVRTLCGFPPSRVSMFDLDIPNLQTDFKRVDFEKLLAVAESALDSCLKQLPN